MATYKVIQDIEAEDKLVGPLSLRQFIYAGICAICLYFSFIAVTKGVAFLLVLFLPPALFTGFFAAPWGRDQPTELWALAKIRFYFKPRKRIWNQSGIKELVTITAPKHVEQNYTNGLTQSEVRSRLNALASTIDSRGWAIKNVSANLSAGNTDSDRLIDIRTMPQEVSNLDVTDRDDILDAQNNPLAQQFDQMIHASSQAHRQQIVEQLASDTTPQTIPRDNTQQLPPDYWFLNQPIDNAPRTASDNVVFANSQIVLPGTEGNLGVSAADPTMTEAAFAEQLKEQQLRAEQASNSSHLRTIQPLGTNPAPLVSSQVPTSNQTVAASAHDEPASNPVTPDPAKIELSRNNDLSVATIARIANKKDGPDENEVVISLR